MVEPRQSHSQTLCTIKEAATLVSYSKDYITRLARDGKIVASHVGRQWYVDIISLQNYAAAMEAEQEIRKRQLSEERRRERQLREIVAEKEIVTEQQKKSLDHQAQFAVAAVFVFGLFAGSYLLQAGSFLHLPGASQVSQVNESQSIAIIDERTPRLQPEFTHAFTESPFGSAQQGILLLPQGSTSTDDVSDYFSDEVIVRRNEHGQSVLIKVDADRVPYGDEIPFLPVPISAEPE